MVTENNNFLHKTVKKSTRGRTPDGDSNPIDKHVGRRIRMQRTLLHISQEKLAKLIGLTFQQVQKYERGMNRVGASRLWDIAKVLGVSIQFFFDDMDEETAQQSPRMFAITEGLSAPVGDTAPMNSDNPMTKRETIELVKAYYRIYNRKAAKNLFDLIVSLSKSPDS